MGGGSCPALLRKRNFAKFLKKPLDISSGLCYYNHCSDAEHLTWGYSSAGRALEWHSRGQRFDPAYLHQERDFVKPWNPSSKAFPFTFILNSWACSSVGRAFGSHPRGREFESLQVHQLDIGRTPIILRAALPSWCGSDVKTNSGGQGIKALTSAVLSVYFVLPWASCHSVNSRWPCSLSWHFTFI